MKQPDLDGRAALRDGRAVAIRPLQSSDVEALTDFFAGLSAETRRLYAPHPFDQATARQLCASVGADPCTRFIVVLQPESARPSIIGYLILAPRASQADVERHGGLLHTDRRAGIAPAVADAFQDQGVGSIMGRHVIACARDMGLGQLFLIGGVRAFTERAIHYYEKLGFRRVGEFWTRDPDITLNYAMLLDL
jgi:GNAT superfamily N-acetyltransferase